MEQIAPNIYVSTAYRYVNVGCVVGPTGVVALDAPTLPQDALAWRHQISQVAELPVVYTVLTDAHPHRLLCAGLLEAPIVASRTAYEHAVEYTRGFWRSVARRLRRNHPEQEQALRDVDPVLPEILFSDTLTLHRAGVDVSVETVEGAAPGSAWMRPYDAQVLFTGDTLVVGRPPVMEDTPDTKAWLETLNKLRRPVFAGTVFVPGRGPVCDQSATHPLSEYIRVARRRARSLHRADRPREDIANSVDELLSHFALSDKERDQLRRQVRNGLRRVYDELASSNSDDG
ncbi:MAG: MBL fold metallo-hydrolase [Anaerolineae bacterium]|jgi:glyoxylase-like metal-dependent hydrolase (beta-lactamase superfamily II)